MSSTSAGEPSWIKFNRPICAENRPGGGFFSPVWSATLPALLALLLFPGYVRSQSPPDPSGIYKQAMTELQNGNLDQAVSGFNKVLEKHPGNADAYKNRGLAYERKGQDDLAFSDYNKAIQLNPRFAEAYNNRGNVYLKRKQMDLAFSDYNKAIECNPRLSVIYLNRGSAYAEKGQYDTAIADYNKARELNPKDARAYLKRGLAFKVRVNWSTPSAISPQQWSSTRKIPKFIWSVPTSITPKNDTTRHGKTCTRRKS